jgi:RES domain-containing protein
MREHPDAEEIRKRFTSVARCAIAVKATVYRFAEPTFATKNDLFTGEGARLYGGRWNPKGAFAAVYTSLSDGSALAESKAHFLYYGWDTANALPLTLVAADVQLKKVLDLTGGHIRQALQVSATRMRSDDWRKLNRRGNESLTQTIGRIAYGAGLEGLVVPACDGERNLVWFPGNLLTGSRVKIRNADKLA